MTQEELKEKIDSAYDRYEELSSFTKIMFHDIIFPYWYDDYVSEYRYLMRASGYCDNVLKIMRTDVVDHDLISSVKYFIGKRLKTIEDERE
jgi:hypothetical protein